MCHVYFQGFKAHVRDFEYDAPPVPQHRFWGILGLALAPEAGVSSPNCTLSWLPRRPTEQLDQGYLYCEAKGNSFAKAPEQTLRLCTRCNFKTLFPVLTGKAR
jgi:hypothetical protein